MRIRLRLPAWSTFSGVLVGVLLVVISSSQLVHARPVRDYTYTDLVAESDVVVIATALSTAADNGRDFDKELRGLENEVESVITHFRIGGIVKGGVKGDRLSLMHYRFKPEQRPIVNAPGLVRFEAEGPVIGKEERTGQRRHGAPPEYLLFLKVTGDGKFVPTTGQMDPDGSVRRIGGADHDKQEKVKRLGN